jgi:hypothetical protein
MDMVTSSVEHGMLTPIKSIGLLSKKLSQKLYGTSKGKDAELIYYTSQLLLSDVKLLLDRKQLDKNRFLTNLDRHPVN